MEQIYNEFCQYLQLKKKSSENTLSSYKNDIKFFIIYLQNKKIDKLDSVTGKTIQSYITSLHKQNKSESTIARNLSSLRCFFKYLVSQKYITFNPMLGIKAKKSQHNLPEILEAKSIDYLLKQPDTSTDKGIRDKAMLEVLYATGIRVSELINIHVNDVNTEVGYIIINRASEKERIVPLYQLAVDSLSLYLKHSRTSFLKSGTKCDILFLSSGGTGMTRQGFWKIIKQYASRAGIKGDITPKILRHSFAAHLLENGADINVLKDMLGHSTISSTKVYTKVLKNKYLSVYENCHPRARQK